MQITVSGKGLDVGESLTQHVNARLEEGIEKYLDRVTDVKVVFSRESHLYRVDILVNPGTHSDITIKGQADSTDVYAAFDQTADKIEKQLRRYKRKLKNHHKARVSDALFEADKYVIADDKEEEAPEEDAPLVIAEKKTAIETLTVSEAVMRMDLANLPALMFFSSVHGGIKYGIPSRRRKYLMGRPRR